MKDESIEEASGDCPIVPSVEVVLKKEGRVVSVRRQEEERPETPFLYGEIEVGFKRVENLGNCNSGQAYVSLRLPVLPKRKSIDQTADWLVRYVKKRLRKELDEIEEEGWDWPRRKL